MRKRYKLTSARIAAVKKPGRHYSDGGNLILRARRGPNKTSPSATASTGGATGARRIAPVSLAEAREKASPMGKLLAAGLDPMVERDKRARPSGRRQRG